MLCCAQYVIGKMDEGIFILNTHGPIPSAPVFDHFKDAQYYIMELSKVEPGDRAIYSLNWTPGAVFSLTGCNI